MASKNGGPRRGKTSSEGAGDGSKSGTGIDPRLPPLWEGLEIFEDLLRNLDAHQNMLGREPLSINVATVCSGTDSPIFALNLIQEAARNLGKDFIHFSHKFACEIETFKQAFIRRNTNQPLIFRNVIELGARGATKAMVAGGYFADIPSDKIDLFIAGCSCVDYSNLNNARAGKTHLPVFDQYPADILSGEKKSPPQLDAEFVERLMESLDTFEMSGAGESAKTFLSAMSYIIRTRPKIVILENVDSAPWVAKTNFWFPRAGYVAAHSKVNSRMYYLPQTRQRGYLIAVDVQIFGAERAEAVVRKCISLLKKLERPASSPVTNFLLGPDDLRLVEARADMEQRNTNQKDTDWGFSQVRHEATRQAEGLPVTARPFSMAVFSHGRLMDVTPPSRSWIQYFKKQPPRVLDFVDIVILKSLQMQCDLRHKTWVLDVSQNVDRSTVFTSTFTSKLGTIGCITPSGQPILTDQMRPITGIEALGLQGLPLDDLVLSTETQAQLQDLAGNAMTVPVVGAVILSALAAGYEVLRETADDASRLRRAIVLADMETSQGPELHVNDVASWSLGSFQGAELETVAKLASRATRLCFCPMVERMASGHSQWLRCRDCGASACDGCRGNPRHHLGEWQMPRRISQAELRLQLGSCLPGVFGLVIDCSDVGAVLSLEQCSDTYTTDISKRMGHNLFYLQHIKVTENVTVDYRSTNLVARLVLTNTGADWYLFPTRRAEDGESELEFSQPVARAKFGLGPGQSKSNKQTLDPSEAAWSVWARRYCDHNLLVEIVPVHQDGAAQALNVRLAADDPEMLQGCNLFPERVLEAIEERVCGVYRHAPQCGTPEDSLFVRQGGSSKQFLFKDVAATGPPKDDEFIFADNNRQLEAGEYRDATLRTFEITMPLPPTEGSFITAYVDGYWAPCKPFLSAIPESIIRRPLGVGSVGAFKGGNGPCCQSNPATLFNLHLDVTELPLPLATVSRWMNGGAGRLNSYIVPPSRLEGFLRDIAFACPGIFDAGRFHLHDLGIKGRGVEVAFCAECCIAPPKNHWNCPDGTSASQPWEDPDDVERFEKKLKKLPPPFAASVKFDGQSFQEHSSGILDINFTLNCRTLPSRAMAHLAHGARSGLFSDVVVRHSKIFCEVDWQYHPELTFDSLIPFHDAIHETSNIYGLREDVFRENIANMPIELPCFQNAGHSLRTDQIGAVRWMIGREVCPSGYPETELEEVVLPGLSTRIVGRAIFENDGSVLCSRGGVAAHDIGYGKTVVVIALLELRRDFDGGQSITERRKTAALWNTSGDNSESFFHLKATLVVVPGHISSQWINEFKKFGSNAKVVKIPDVKTLEKQSLKTLQDADVIVVSEGFFRSTVYLENIDRLGATPESRSKPSAREAQDRYRTCCQLVRWAVSRYLQNGQDVVEANDGLRRLVEERQQAGQRLAQEYVAPSTRKGAKRTKSNTGQKTSRCGGDVDQGRGRKRKVPGRDREQGLLWHPTRFLENFSFSRIIVDEYSYQTNPTLSFLSNSLSYAKWLLSGTPPSQNLANITDVGLALGIHVARPEPCVRPGLPAVTEGPKLHPMSASEEFRSFSTRVKSIDFIMERHSQGVEFVRHVYRSNEADHSHITIRERVMPVRLHPRTAAYYNVAHLEILDANGNLLQVPMELRSLLNRANIAATNTGEAAASLALTAIANGILGNGEWFGDMARALGTSVNKFKNDAKFCFDKLVWLLDRANSVGTKTRQDSKFQSVRNVAEGIIRNVISDFRGENRDLSRYGGPVSFILLMSKIAGPTKIERISGPPRALYLPSRDSADFEYRRWRRDMALTCWLDWYNIDESQVREMDRAELIHLASDLILLSYSHKQSPNLQASWSSDQLSSHVNAIKSLLEGGSYENWSLRQTTHHRSVLYEQEGLPMLESLDNDILAKFILDCQQIKTAATNTFKLSQHIDANGKTGKAELRELCRNHNLRCADADSAGVLLDKINRYNRGLTDGNDHIDGRGASRAKEFPMLNKIKKARGSGTEATIDELSITYQRFIRNQEDYVQARRREQFIDTISRLAKGFPITYARCDECVCALRRACDVFIVVACGHIVCFECKAKMDQDHERALCSVESCGAYCRNSPILRLSDLYSGVPFDEIRSCIVDQPPTKGAPMPIVEMSEKLEAIVNLVKNIPASDHVLLFVPFVWLASELRYWFDMEGISYLCLVTDDKLSDDEMSNLAEQFKAGQGKVLILNPTEVSCAGINLTIANHVIFAAPFLDPDVHRRNQNMRQAVGRCVRPGQEKDVFVYHFMAENTIEERVLRDYARTHQTRGNALERYFKTSPKPWWLLDDETARDNSSNGDWRTPSVTLSPEPQKTVQPAQDQPEGLAPAGGALPNFDCDMNDFSFSPSPDLWLRMQSQLSPQTPDRMNPQWDLLTVRSAVLFEKLNRLNARRYAAETGWKVGQPEEPALLPSMPKVTAEPVYGQLQGEGPDDVPEYPQYTHGRTIDNEYTEEELYD